LDASTVETWVRSISLNRKIWTEDLSAVPGFISTVADDVELILDKGMKGTLEIKVNE
jgi:hypothetical protein